jgi:hypothetical protein
VPLSSFFDPMMDIAITLKGPNALSSEHSEGCSLVIPGITSANCSGTTKCDIGG